MENSVYRRAEEKGIAKGMEKGREKVKIEIALNMLNSNMSIENISNLTGLTLDTVEKLAKK